MYLRKIVHQRENNPFLHLLLFKMKNDVHKIDKKGNKRIIHKKTWKKRCDRFFLCSWRVSHIKTSELNIKWTKLWHSWINFAGITIIFIEAEHLNTVLKTYKKATIYHCFLWIKFMCSNAAGLCEYGNQGWYFCIVSFYY